LIKDDDRSCLCNLPCSFDKNHLVIDQMMNILDFDQEEGCLKAMLRHLCQKTIEGRGSIHLSKVYDCFDLELQALYPHQVLFWHDCALRNLTYHRDRLFNLIQTSTKLFILSYWQSLTTLAKLIQFHLKQKNELSLKNAKASYFCGLNLAQEKALMNALSSRFMILTGGPGTGKTFTSARILQALADHLSLNGSSVKALLLAPTGKAVVRLLESIDLDGHESIKIEAMTIHALLAQGKKIGGFHAQLNPAPYHIILVDEASMIDIRLLISLLNAIHSQTRLVLMGDPFQLPPIESEGLFGDLCLFLKETSHLSHLEVSLRTQNDQLSQVAKAITTSNWKLFYSLASPFSSFDILPNFADSTLLDFFSAKTGDSLSPLQALKRAMQKVVLCASNQGKLGTRALNQKVFSQKRLLMFSASLPYLDIPVMATVNQPQLMRVNGEIGLIRILKSNIKKTFDLIEAIRQAEGVYFYDASLKKEIYVPRIRLQALVPAWAISVHKSQGSEFDEVIIVLPAASRIFGKALLYTALTRAKKSVTLIADGETLETLVSEKLEAETGLNGILNNYS
jgi:exodeoxyribonuclease V alpha subunit